MMVDQNSFQSPFLPVFQLLGHQARLSDKYKISMLLGHHRTFISAAWKSSDWERPREVTQTCKRKAVGQMVIWKMFALIDLFRVFGLHIDWLLRHSLRWCSGTWLFILLFASHSPQPKKCPYLCMPYLPRVILHHQANFLKSNVDIKIAKFVFFPRMCIFSLLKKSLGPGRTL